MPFKGLPPVFSSAPRFDLPIDHAACAPKHRVTKAKNTTTAIGAIPYAFNAHRSVCLNPALIAVSNQDCASGNPSHLIGCSVTPETAEKTKGSIIYDGHGVVRGFKSEYLSRQVRDEVVKGITMPLYQLPQKSEELISTPSSALIDIAMRIEHEEFRGKAVFLQRLKNIYLEGNVSLQSLKDTVEILRSRTSGAHPELYKRVENIVARVRTEFHVTLHNDNLYGRFFDTCLARAVVENPSMGMLQARDILRNEMISDFMSYSGVEKSRLCICIAEKMENDVQAWRQDIPECLSFLESNTPERFLKLLNCDSDYSVPLVTLIMVKYILAKPAGYSKLLNDATSLYKRVISTQRNLSRIENSHEVSHRDGINLHYQNVDVHPAIKHTGVGIRPIDRYRTNVDSVSEHDQLALVSGRAMGVGMSGSSNILNHVMQKIIKTHPAFPVDDAKLMIAAALTFSGGHSINEAYTVFNFKDHQSFAPTSYATLYGKGEPYRSAIDQAYAAVMKLANKLDVP
jgi:hypothetical protein